MDVTIEHDVVFATVDGEQLLADLYLPDTETPAPVVVHLHGGAWVGGDKGDGGGERQAALARHGVAVVSVNYRLVPAVRYPTLIHDSKAAVRWVRAHAAAYGFSAEKVGIWGASAGGYLAAMVGLSAGDAELEGEVGHDRAASSAVDAVVAWFPAGDLEASTYRSALEARILPPPAEAGLFGRDRIDPADPDLVAANPRNRAHADAPPFLIAHGDRDHMVPETQGRMLHDALVRAGADSTFVVLGGAGHEDAAFDAESHIAMTAAWLRARLG